MATYVNNLRLTELATGEGSGTWGTTTNTNLELIGEALGYGSEAIANASTHTITVADGTADSARSFYLKLTGGGQACTVTLAPNTLSKVWMVENTTNSTLTFSQGSGANVAVPAGQVKMIATDGAGSGAVVYDLLVDTDLTGTTTVVNLTSSGTIDAATVEFNSLSGTGSVAITDILDQDNMSSDSATALATQQSIKAYVDSSVASFDTLAEVLAQGNTTGSTDIEVTTAQKVQFRDSAIYINSSADGQLDIVADTEIQIAATTIDANGNLDVSGTIAAGGVVTANAGVVVDTMTIDGSAIASTGSLGLDIGGNLTIDVDGTTITLADGGANWGQMFNSAQNFYFKNPTADKDIIFQGIDGSTAITMLTLDASLAGQATFGGNLTVQGADVTITGNVIHAGDTNTYFGFHDADQWRVVTGGTERIEITNTEVVINDSSVDMDFRVESDSNANMLLVNGGNNSVSIGTSTSEGTFTVGGSATFNADSADADFRVESNGQTHMLFIDGGNNRVGVGTNAPSAPFHSSNTSSGITARFSNDVNQTLDIGTVSGTGANGSVYIDNANSGNIQLRTGNAERLNILASGNITIKTVDSFLYSPASSGGTYIDAGLKFESSNKKLEFWTADAERMSIASDGAATFSSTIAATSATFTASTASMTLTKPDEGNFSLSFDGSNSNIASNSSGATINLQPSSTTRMSLAVGGTLTTFPLANKPAVFNENGVDADFRVESDGNANMLFVDGGNDFVSVGTATNFSSTFNVFGATALNRGTGGATTASGATLSIQGTGSFNSNYFGSSLATVAIRSNEPANNSWNPTLHITTIRQSLGTNKDSNGGIGFSTIDDSNNTGVDDAARITIFNENSASNTSPTAIRFYNNVGGSKTQASQAALDLFSTGAVFNNDSNDMDFRVESDGNANMLVVDASTNTVVIGNAGASNSSQHLAVHGNTGLGNRLTSSSGGGYVTEISGTSLTTDGSNWYGSYGVLNFYATASYTGSARRWTLTNGWKTNRFAFLVGDTDTSSQPELDGNGGGESNSFVPLWFDSGTGGAVFNDSGKDADFRVESDTNTHALFVDAGNSAVLIGQSANVGPGNGNTTTGGGWETSGRFWASTSNSDHGFNRNSNGVNVSIRNSGTQIGYIFNNASSVTYNTTSDQRLKENIADADDAGSKIDAIQVRKFDWKADGSHQDYGMVAQELLQVEPRAVAQPEDSELMMGVDYSVLVPMLIKEIQSLRARVADLES